MITCPHDPDGLMHPEGDCERCQMPVTDVVRETVPHFDRSDRDLLLCAVRQCEGNARRVMLRFGVGSTVARILIKETHNAQD